MAMLGWQESGVTCRREAWVLEGRGCGVCSVGIFMAGGALAVH